MYPTTICDNFFDEPDKVVEFALAQKYYPNDGRYPGTRTDQIVNLDRSLYDWICVKILSMFHPELPNYWDFEMAFQKISPFSKHQYDPKNRRWIHVDKGRTYFGGIVYLNKHPEKDTGTSIYSQKKGWSSQFFGPLDVKNRFYRGDEIPDEEYEYAWNAINSQYEESCSIENVYNRMALFNNSTFHGVKTFGKKQDRLTLVFFCRETPGVQPPLFR